MWLISLEVMEAMRVGMISGIKGSPEFEARYIDEAGNDSPRILTKAGDTAEIFITGVMTQAPNFMAFLFGGGNTTYSEILAAIASAEQDPQVRKIDYRIESGGGQFDGLFQVLDAIKAGTKPTRAIIQNVAASAAYAVAAQADRIEAVNRAARIGSVGVRASFEVDENEVVVASTKAPRKAPDPTTDAGKAMIREEIDPMHDLFVEYIAAGRGVDPEKVNTQFGQGATFLADEAVKRGMIDGLVGQNANQSKGVQAMDKNELKDKHYNTYQAILLEGIEKGQSQERDRVGAHLVAAQGSGLIDVAIDAVLKGEPMTETLRMQHTMAAVNKQQLDSRINENQEEIDKAGKPKGDKGQGAGDQTAEEVVGKLEARFGISEVA